MSILAFLSVADPLLSLASPRPSNIRVFLASRSRRSFKSPMIHPGCPGLVKLRRVQPSTKQVEASVPYYPFLSRMTSFTENNCTADKISPTGITDSAEMDVSEFQNFRGVYTTFDLQFSNCR